MELEFPHIMGPVQNETLVFPKSETFRSELTLGSFIFCKWPWKRKQLRRRACAKYLNNWNSISAITFFLFPIFTLLSPAISHPLISSQSDCDWNGRGALLASSNSMASGSRSIQTMTFRCTRGRVHWEDPIGGLRVEIRPTLVPPYKLCLEEERLVGKSNSQKRVHRILLEEPSGRLLQVLSTDLKNSDCYEISSPSAILYVESSSGGGVSAGNQVESQNDDAQRIESSHLVSLAYEVEPLRGDGDPCRPCSEAEILKSFCSADVVARGSILQIIPGFQYDSIYIKSDLVLHQNQPVFTPFQPPMLNFLTTLPRRFDMDRPQRVTRSSQRGQAFQGIISHPSKCGAAVGDGDFLWLIKFRFGMPLTECTLYWDQWVDVAKRSQGECPLSTD